MAINPRNPSLKALWRLYNQDARNINRAIARQERTAAILARQQGEPSSVRQAAKVSGK